MAFKLKIAFAVTVVLFSLSVTTLACTCTYRSIKADGFRGQVFAVTNGKQLPDFNSPIPKATVKLLKRIGDEDKVVAEVAADETGNFSLENVESGKYFLKVESTYFTSVWVQLKISDGSRRKNDKIVIALAPGLTCCEGYAGVQRST